MANPVDPRGIAYTESRGMNLLQKLWPGKHGEVGTYQLRPTAFEDLRRLDPKYKNANFYVTAAIDPFAKDASMAYMQQLHDHYNIPQTAEALTQAYNRGPVGYKNGARNPQYYKTYQEGVANAR